MRVQLAVGLSTVLGVGMLIVPTAQADPGDLETARASLAKIEEKSSQVDQQLIEAADALGQAQVKLDRLRGDITAQRERVKSMKAEMGQIAIYQYATSGVPESVQLLAADDPSEFLSSLSTMRALTERTNVSLQAYQAEQSRLKDLTAQQEATVEQAAEAKKRAAKLAKDYDALEADARAVVDRLSEAERARLAAIAAQEAADAQAQAAERTQTPSRESERDAASTDAAALGLAAGPVSDKAQRAVQIALAQVGKAYVWGSAGPNSFDCSGLTSYAYGQVGVALPRSSRAQSGMGARVSASEMRPGDLVFYYSPVSHVGIYIGGGKIVHASSRKTGVKISAYNHSPINVIRRIV